jgi:hypothetical protein
MQHAAALARLHLGPEARRPAIKRERRRRSAIESVIGHLKENGHLGRNFSSGRHGDQNNAVLSAIGHNLRLVLSWLRRLLPLVVAAFLGHASVTRPGSVNRSVLPSVYLRQSNPQIVIVSEEGEQDCRA